MVAVQRVAAAGEVVIAPFLVQHVINGVVQAPKAECRPVLVALAGVVVNHVENHFDAGPVERLHHLLEFADLLAGLGGVGGLGAKKTAANNPSNSAAVRRSRVLARAFQFVELQHRHQLHGRHAERFQVAESSRQAEERARVGDAGRRVAV